MPTPPPPDNPGLAPAPSAPGLPSSESLTPLHAGNSLYPEKMKTPFRQQPPCHPHLKAAHSPSTSVDASQRARPSLCRWPFRQGPRHLNWVPEPHTLPPRSFPTSFPGTFWLQKLSCLPHDVLTLWILLVSLHQPMAIDDQSPDLCLKQHFAESGCSRFPEGAPAQGLCPGGRVTLRAAGQATPRGCLSR